MSPSPFRSDAPTATVSIPGTIIVSRHCQLDRDSIASPGPLRTLAATDRTANPRFWGLEGVADCPAKQMIIPLEVNTTRSVRSTPR
jgi:hypothetical protein